MVADIKTFENRWNTVSGETLAAVRRECDAYTFDNTAVERAFRSSCNEWFEGSLGPSLWYDALKAERPDVASKFKEYVGKIHFESQSYTRPSRVGSYVATALSLPVCYFSLDWFTEMGLLSKALTTVGTAVLVWYVCQTLIRNKESRLEESLVDSYLNQLKTHLEAIKKILS